MLTTILFDLDGTLAPFMQDDFVEAYFKLLLRRVVPMGYNGGQLTAAIWKGTEAMVENDGSATNRQVFWEKFTALLGIGALGLENILDDFYVRDFDSVRSVLREQADRGGLIKSLREKNYSVVLATNPIFPLCAVETRLHWVGLSSADFDFVTTYENSRHCKPNPLYYQDILDKMGKKAEECLMVGNNPVDDMAALDAGLAAYLAVDYLENPGKLPLEPYPHGSFREVERSLEHLKPV